LSGAPTLIKKVWAKFEDMDLVCVCEDHTRGGCIQKGTELVCKEYVVKFMEIDREQVLDDAMAHLEKESKNLRRDIKSFQSKVSRSIKKFKI